ncbi:MAG TPA: cytochrome c3 family protein [Blastocatellia bacterium]|nr:cytochrome c3 family protein [Blastocatellia bacterium]
MPQTFHRSTNTISRLTIYGAIFIAALLSWVLSELSTSSYATQAFTAREQPVQFSHKHHVADDGIDCRYCHTSVETSSFAGIPPTKTCMNCHRQIWADSPMLEPVRESFRTGIPIQWTRVHDLPDFVYFNHSIHVNKGVGCSTCHGQVDEMPLTWQVNTLQMKWCLECHRNPELFVRPRDQVFNMGWQSPPNQEEQGRKLVREYKIQSPQVLTSCDTCHR